MTASPRHLTFPGHRGDQLAARLDLPAGPPLAYAVLAHCFTCGKDLRVASRLASGLTRAGVAVLRFDMTGLGDSEGDVAATDVSSNVDDLVAAADWLRAEYRAPQLLVGHSLGGAAAILAADRIPEVRAIVTIGAPSDTSHLTRLLTGSLDEIRERGAATVQLAGREFTIRSEFLDDLAQHRVTEALATWRGALLILHSPIDEEVSIDHAAELYRAARHPKSFVALDGADHLVTDPDDAEFVASMVGAWSQRHLVPEVLRRDPPRPTAQVVVAETAIGAFHNDVVVGDHRFVADEPVAVGGYDAGPSPYDLLSAALGACTSMTLRMYGDRKGWPLDRVLVEVSHDRIHADDAAEAGEPADASSARQRRPAMIDRFTRVLHLEGDLDDEARARLRQIADRCPVHRTLEQSSRIDTELA